jgi:hypothetical protein
MLSQKNGQEDCFLVGTGAKIHTEFDSEGEEMPDLQLSITPLK